MHYSGGQASPVRGGKSGDLAEVVLESGEFVVTIEGAVDFQIMAKLAFVTNKGALAPIELCIVLTIEFVGRRFGPYGRGRTGFTLETFVWNGTDGVSTNLAPHMGLLYFSGHSGWVQLTLTF